VLVICRRFDMREKGNETEKRGVHREEAKETEHTNGDRGMREGK